MLIISWKGSYSGCLVINSAFLASRSSPLLVIQYKENTKHHFSIDSRGCEAIIVTNGLEGICYVKNLKRFLEQTLTGILKKIHTL